MAWNREKLAEDAAPGDVVFDIACPLIQGEALQSLFRNSVEDAFVDSEMSRSYLKSVILCFCQIEVTDGSLRPRDRQKKNHSRNGSSNDTPDRGNNRNSNKELEILHSGDR
jgi:hypothetical protein